MNEQIEEMQNELCINCKQLMRCSDCVKSGCSLMKIVDILYNAGYRKQREGVWIWVEDDKDGYEQYWVCTECGGRDYFGSKFCPNCGAHMRGGSDV